MTDRKQLTCVSYTEKLHNPPRDDLPLDEIYVFVIFWDLVILWEKN